MEKLTEINNKEGRRLALIAGRAALCAVNIHSISDAKKKEKSALYYPNVPPRPGAVISVSIKAILQSWCKIYIVLCSQTFKIWPFPLRVSRFYIIPLQLYHPRDKSASKRFKIGFLVLSGWNILFCVCFQGARLGLGGPLALSAFLGCPACCFVAVCLQVIKAGDKSFRFGDVVLRKKIRKGPKPFFLFFFLSSFFFRKKLSRNI